MLFYGMSSESATRHVAVSRNTARRKANRCCLCVDQLKYRT